MKKQKHNKTKTLGKNGCIWKGLITPLPLASITVHTVVIISKYSQILMSSAFMDCERSRGSVKLWVCDFRERPVLQPKPHVTTLKSLNLSHSEMPFNRSKCEALRILTQPISNIACKQRSVTVEMRCTNSHGTTSTQMLNECRQRSRPCQRALVLW